MLPDWLFDGEFHYIRCMTPDESVRFWRELHSITSLPHLIYLF